MSRGFASNYRIVFLAAGNFLCFGGVAARLVDLHVWQRAELLKYVEQARRSFVVENARRGNIRDYNGVILATSRTLIDVGLDPHMLRPEDEARWPDLARLLDVHPSMGSKILRGERSLTVEHLRKLCERFKVNPRLFID